MKIALAQMNSGPDWRKNLSQILKWMEAAQRKNGKLFLTPENTFYMGDPKNLRKTAEEMLSVVLPTVQAAAKRLKLATFIGGYPEIQKGEKRVFNSSIFISETGKILKRYRKIHMFDVRTPTGERYQESKTYAPGKKIETLRWKGIRIGFSICYDVRFPEHYRALLKKGVDWILVPSAFTKETGKAHWHTLLRARSIENLSVVISPAQTGRHPMKRETFGHSLVVSPWGKVLFDAGRKPGLYFADAPQNALEIRRTFGAAP